MPASFTARLSTGRFVPISIEESVSVHVMAPPVTAPPVAPSANTWSPTMIELQTASMLIVSPSSPGSPGSPLSGD